MTNRATIFLNGRRPTKKTIGAFNRPIMCSDGALKYVQPLGIAPDFVIGDFDSQTPENTKSNTVTYVELSDQNTTDFEKILAFSSERGVEKADVYGASGNEQDHFLGNLHAALRFKNTIDIRFFDETYEYFFCNKTVERKNMRGKRFSLVPFPEAVRVSTVGCQYPLDKYTLTFGTFIGIRNVATQDRLRISFESGELLLFIER